MSEKYLVAGWRVWGWIIHSHRSHGRKNNRTEWISRQRSREGEGKKVGGSMLSPLNHIEIYVPIFPLVIRSMRYKNMLYTNIRCAFFYAFDLLSRSGCSAISVPWKNPKSHAPAISLYLSMCCMRHYGCVSISIHYLYICILIIFGHCFIVLICAFIIYIWISGWS